MYHIRVTSLIYTRVYRVPLYSLGHSRVYVTVYDSSLYLQGSAEGQSRSKKPPKYLRAQSRGRGTQQCVISGRDHQLMYCEQHKRKCFRCGQVGHFSHHCSGRDSPAPPVALAPATLRQYGGAPPAAVARRALMLRQHTRCPDRLQMVGYFLHRWRSLLRMSTATSGQVLYW